ncbi:MAG: KH domain-containing protein [Coriobacteriales bacterium]|jgi:predicted RNA-binding protein YlqC (UPF0109 family)|nr:KH domain-containing protein [Coriobacteriales bacterium]
MAEKNHDIVELVRLIVTTLVDEPEEVQLASRQDGSALIIEVKVADGDAGKIIGRQGRIIKSLRTLARAASAYQGAGHVEVEVLD